MNEGPFLVLQQTTGGQSFAKNAKDWPPVDRGEVVAELLPPGQGHGDPSVPAGLQALARRGLLTLGAPAGTGLYPALVRKRGEPRRSIAELLDEERGTR